MKTEKNIQKKTEIDGKKTGKMVKNYEKII